MTVVVVIVAALVFLTGVVWWMLLAANVFAPAVRRAADDRPAACDRIRPVLSRVRRAGPVGIQFVQAWSPVVAAFIRPVQQPAPRRSPADERQLPEGRPPG